MADAGIDILAGSGAAAAQSQWRGATARAHARMAPQLALVN